MEALSATAGPRAEGRPIDVTRRENKPICDRRRVGWVDDPHPTSRAQCWIGAPEELIVDDDEDLCGLVATVLREEGYHVRTASNGAEALDNVRAHGVPDLILLDMRMPVMDGWEFARRLDAEYDHEAPVVVISAAENPGQRAADIGANGWIGKPFDIDGLVGTVDQHVRRSGMGPSGAADHR